MWRFYIFYCFLTVVQRIIVRMRNLNAEQSMNNKPKAEVVKKNNKPNYWSEVQKTLKISDDQLTSLEEAKTAFDSTLKSKSGADRRAYKSAFRTELGNLLGESRLGAKYLNFDRDWNNPLSYYNLRRELSLSRTQIQQINQLRKDSRKAIQSISVEDKEARKAEVQKIKRSELDQIIVLLTDDQKTTLDTIKNRIPEKRLPRLTVFQ